MKITVKFTANEKGSPAGKLADAELQFSPDFPLLGGLKLIGFSIWERRSGTGRNVTFPARQYSVNGERRTFALLRPMVDVEAQTRLRDAIVRAFEHVEEQAALQDGDGSGTCNEVELQVPRDLAPVVGN